MSGLFNLNYDLTIMMEEAIHKSRLNKYRKEHNLKDVCKQISLMKEWCDNEYDHRMQYNEDYQNIYPGVLGYTTKSPEELMTDIIPSLHNDIWDDYVEEQKKITDRMNEIFFLIKRPLIY